MPITRINVTVVQTDEGRTAYFTGNDEARRLIKVEPGNYFSRQLIIYDTLEEYEAEKQHILVTEAQSKLTPAEWMAVVRYYSGIANKAAEDVSVLEDPVIAEDPALLEQLLEQQEAQMKRDGL